MTMNLFLYLTENKIDKTQNEANFFLIKYWSKK